MSRGAVCEREAGACRRRRVQRLGGLARLQVVQRAVIDERGDGHVADELAVAQHAHAPAVGDLADRRAVHLPLGAQLEHGVDVGGLDDAQHPLLGLADHDLERLHAGLAQGYPGDVEVDPDAALGGHLGGGGGEAGGAEVLQRDDQAALEQLERALEQLLLLERVADLDGRALVVVAVAA